MNINLDKDYAYLSNFLFKDLINMNETTFDKLSDIVGYTIVYATGRSGCLMLPFYCFCVVYIV